MFPQLFKKVICVKKRTFWKYRPCSTTVQVQQEKLECMVTTHLAPSPSVGGGVCVCVGGDPNRWICWMDHMTLFLKQFFLTQFVNFVCSKKWTLFSSRLWTESGKAG